MVVGNGRRDRFAQTPVYELEDTMAAAKTVIVAPAPVTTILDLTLEPAESTKNFVVFGNGTTLPQHAGKCVLLTNSKGQVYIGTGFNSLDPKRPVRIRIEQ